MSVTRQQFKDLADNFVDNVFNDFTKSFTIESFAETADGQGGFTVAWSTFATITGFVKKLTGREIIQDDRIKSDYAVKFSFQYVAGITEKMRISYNSKVYNIVEIKPIQEADVWIDIVAAEEVAT